MFSNNREFYDFINSLIKKLESVGEIYWSIEFSKAINISLMIGEVFGATRFTLKRFQETNIPSRLGIEKEIQNSIASLDKALGSDNL